jgi:hypothetical protein
MKSTFAKMTTLLSVILAGALLTATAIAQLEAADRGGWRNDDDKLTQMAELEQQIHVTFHAAVSVHDPINGDSAEEITQRIREVLSIWAKDAELTAAAGNYIGNGDPDDPESCPPPSGDSSLRLVNRARCARFSSMSPAGCSKPISLYRFPRRTKRNMSL